MFIYMAITVLAVWTILLIIQVIKLSRSLDNEKSERRLLVLKIENAFNSMKEGVYDSTRRQLFDLRSKLLRIEHALNMPGESEKLLALIDHLGLKFMPEQKELKRAHFVDKESK